MVEKITHEQNRRNIARRRRRVAARHARAGRWGAQPRPMLGSGAVRYEAGANIDATSFGGIAAVHRLVTCLGLVERIDEDLQVLKVHLPYHESEVAWTPLQRPDPAPPRTGQRRRREPNHKRRIVAERGYVNLEPHSRRAAQSRLRKREMLSWAFRDCLTSATPPFVSRSASFPTLEIAWSLPGWRGSVRGVDTSGRERFRGCLLGGAVGDALGAPVEFHTRDQISCCSIGMIDMCVPCRPSKQPSSQGIHLDDGEASPSVVLRCGSWFPEPAQRSPLPFW